MKPDKVVNSERLYAEYDMTYDDVDDDHKHLIPYMKQLETGDLVELGEYDNEWTWMANYYMHNKVSKWYPPCSLTLLHVIADNTGEVTHFGVYLMNLPAKPAPHIQKQIEEAEALEKKQHRKLIWLRGFFTLYEYIKLLFFS